MYRSHHQFEESPTIYGGKAILKRYILRILQKEARLSQDFNVGASLFQISGAATEKACLPRFITPHANQCKFLIIVGQHRTNTYINAIDDPGN